jgi:hypothetical protein
MGTRHLYWILTGPSFAVQCMIQEKNISKNQLNIFLLHFLRMAALKGKLCDISRSVCRKLYNFLNMGPQGERKRYSAVQAGNII